MGSKYNVNDRQFALINGFDKAVNSIKRDIYKGHSVEIDGVVYGHCSSLIGLRDLRTLKWFDVGYLLVASQHRKKTRVKKKIGGIVEDNEAVFLTLTFDDKVLSTTSKETRRRYVRRFLKQVSDVYVANIDYGKLNGREHYHAVVNKSVNLAYWHKYGGIKAEKIRSKADDTERVSKYISKLSHHALKNRGDMTRLIYSRNISIM